MSSRLKAGAVAGSLMFLAGLVWLPAHAADDHASGHSSGHVSGKGKGPKYGGGNRGSSHSSEVHKQGNHGQPGATGGSKSLEGKVFVEGSEGRGKGPGPMGGSSGEETNHHDDGETHEH